MAQFGAAWPIHVVIVDDHPLVLSGTSTCLQMDPIFRVVGLAHDGRTALEIVNRLHPHLVVLDIHLPDISGLKVAEQLLRIQPELKIIALTGHAEPGWLETLCALGVRGYLDKSSTEDEILSVARLVASGEYALGTCFPSDQLRYDNALTRRERQVLQFLQVGQRNAQIAQSLGISSKTVEYHISNLLAKLGARSRTELVYQAQNHGILTSTPVPVAPHALVDVHSSP